MWLILAFVSATFLGFYDASKKASLKNNAVLPVLLLNTIFSTIIFSPFLIDYMGGFGWFSGSFLDTAPFSHGGQESGTEHLSSLARLPRNAGSSVNSLGIRGISTTHPVLAAHLMVILKAFIVLSSWICGYFGLKHLPLTIVGPINATRPVMVLVGALLFFGEAEYISVDWCYAGFAFHIPDEPGRKEGRHRFQEQQMDMVSWSGHYNGSRQRPV